MHPELLLLGLHSKPALLFLIAEKDPAGRLAKRLAPEPPSAGQTYFEPGVLQLPTVGQIKRLYNSVQNRFYKQVLKGALNDTTKTKARGNGNSKSKEGNGALFYAVRASTRVSACSMIFQI